MAYPTALGWVYFVVVARPSDGPAQANPALQITYTAGKAAQFLLPVLCVLTWERRWPRPAAPNFRGLLFGVAFGLVVGAAILALFHLWLAHSPLLRETPAKLRAKVAEFGMDTPLGYVVLAAFISVIHSLLEEYYWRWFVFGNLRALVPVAAAILLSSLAFMAHHVVVLSIYFPGRFWTVAVPLSLCIAVGGAVWAWLYQRTGSIYPPWVSHMLIDGAIMVVGYRLLFA
jgi:hypothetical protein